MPALTADVVYGLGLIDAAKAYAGHTDTGSDTGATATYVRATTHEVATALAALTGEPHPLATQERW